MFGGRIQSASLLKLLASVQMPSTDFSFFLFLQPFFAFINEEKFPGNGWLVYNPMVEYRRQVSFLVLICVLLFFPSTSAKYSPPPNIYFKHLFTFEGEYFRVEQG